jgi:hypothetical protein
MSVKNVTLYSLPYVVGVASILAVAQTIPSQIVNRALKQNRLPMHRASFTRPSEIKIRSTEPSTVRQIVVDPATG